MIEICKKTDCVGCSACLSACNSKAIIMQSDTLGFLYPKIEQNNCKDCGVCAMSCFNNHKPIYNEPLQTYIGYASDINEQMSSTSGGMASVFMRFTLMNGGVVYGCSGENAREVKHIRIESPEEVVKLKGSKYVQSYMGLTYKTVVGDLKAGRRVLFIGTPCQVAGLKAYLKGRIFSNLFTIDFVCHGVPSQQILNDAIDVNLTDSSELRLINRVKENGKESKYTLRLLKDNQIVMDDTYPSRGYITGFLCGLYYRESCYHCQFARRERVSDITLGDFWDRTNEVSGFTNKKNGLSMIMVNTVLGERLMSMCKVSMVYKSWNYEDFIKRNGQLNHSIDKHPERNQFEELYSAEGFEKAIKVSLARPLKNIRKSLVRNRIRNIIVKIPKVGKLILK